MDEPCPGPDIACGNQIDLYTGPLTFVLIMAAVLALMAWGIWMVVHYREAPPPGPRPRHYRFDDAHLDKPIDDERDSDEQPGRRRG